MAITDQLNCHRCLMKAFDWALAQSMCLTATSESPQAQLAVQREESASASVLASPFSFYHHMQVLFSPSALTRESYALPDLSDRNLSNVKANILLRHSLSGTHL